MSKHASEISQGERFAFGENWRKFLDTLTPARIAEAERSLRDMLGRESLEGVRFLDVGSGSGLFSLAARRLGAQVQSFDYDPQSVACTSVLRERFFEADAKWIVTEGSVLDREFLAGLGEYDVVYSWGVLHHTGAMWQALDNVAPLVVPGGALFLAIYNHQPLWTPLNTLLKRTYVGSPRPLQGLLAAASMTFHATGGLVKDVVRLRNPLARYLHYDQLRGMNWWHDQLDWVGGYPFETATSEQIVDFYQQRGFTVERLMPCRHGGSGCNQFVFRRTTVNV